MIRRFCDCCGAELEAKNLIDGHINRLGGVVRDKLGAVALKVEVITAESSTWNKGDFCKYCVLDALYNADDRVKEVVCTENMQKSTT